MSELHGSSQKQLRAFIERVERLEEEKAALAADIKDVFSEAKATGFDVKVMRQVIRIRKQEAHVRAENEAILATYLHALGMLDEVDGDAAGGDGAFSVAAE